jgi:hypothetical protein
LVKLVDNAWNITSNPLDNAGARKLHLRVGRRSPMTGQPP